MMPGQFRLRSPRAHTFTNRHTYRYTYTQGTRRSSSTTDIFRITDERDAYRVGLHFEVSMSDLHLTRKRKAKVAAGALLSAPILASS